jgi:hypothetical protein
MDLLVVRPFGAYAVGDRITDADTIIQLLRDENASKLVRVAPLPPPPAAAAKGKG